MRVVLRRFCAASRSANRHDIPRPETKAPCVFKARHESPPLNSRGLDLTLGEAVTRLRVSKN